MTATNTPDANASEASPILTDEQIAADLESKEFAAASIWARAMIRKLLSHLQAREEQWGKERANPIPDEKRLADVTAAIRLVMYSPRQMRKATCEDLAVAAWCAAFGGEFYRDEQTNELKYRPPALTPSKQEEPAVELKNPCPECGAFHGCHFFDCIYYVDPSKQEGV